MPKAGKLFEKSSSSNLYIKNSSKYPDILLDFLMQILNKSDFLWRIFLIELGLKLHVKT